MARSSTPSATQVAISATRAALPNAAQQRGTRRRRIASDLKKIDLKSSAPTSHIGSVRSADEDESASLIRAKDPTNRAGPTELLVEDDASASSTLTEDLTHPDCLRSLEIVTSFELPYDWIHGLGRVWPGQLDWTTITVVPFDLPEELHEMFRWRKPQYRHIKKNIYRDVVRPKLIEKYDVSICNCKKLNLDCSDENCINRALYVACADSCPVKKCKNKFAPQSVNPPQLKVIKTENSGWGLVTENLIPANAFICEYKGEVISSSEYQVRRNYHWQKGVTETYFLSLGADTFIDARDYGSLARFINHSCSPNATGQKWTVGNEVRIAIIASQKILPGEEINIDYGFDHMASHESPPCNCNAANCSGFIGAKLTGNEIDVAQSDLDKEGLEDEECFECGEGGSLLVCSFPTCYRVFHVDCLELPYAPQGQWRCPCHLCDHCNKPAAVQCVSCVTSWCRRHSPIVVPPSQYKMPRPVVFRQCSECMEDDICEYLPSVHWRALLDNQQELLIPRPFELPKFFTAFDLDEQPTKRRGRPRLHDKPVQNKTTLGRANRTIMPAVKLTSGRYVKRSLQSHSENPIGQKRQNLCQMPCRSRRRVSPNGDSLESLQNAKIDVVPFLSTSRVTRTKKLSMLPALTRASGPYISDLNSRKSRSSRRQTLEKTDTSSTMVPTQQSVKRNLRKSQRIVVPKFVAVVRRSIRNPKGKKNQITSIDSRIIATKRSITK